MYKKQVKIRTIFPISVLIILGLIPTSSSGQQVDITLGPDQVAINQPWPITITAHNSTLQSYSEFPNISGLRKQGSSSQSSTSIVNGQISSSQSIVMSYLPTRQGQISIPSFTMQVNGKNIQVPGKTINVTPPRQSRDPFNRLFDDDPMNSFFGRGKIEYVNIKADAQLALTLSKNRVYVGEGFNTTLSFLVSNQNKAPMEFYQLGQQLTEILKKLRPTNCWEENFNIKNVEGKPITIQGKRFTKYTLYQGTFYPLNTNPVIFPSVGLKMIKYKVAKNPSFFGQNKKEGFKTFYSKKRSVRVHPLPPHPRKDQVAVGQYQLEENLHQKTGSTGQSVGYDFTIRGEGNILSISKPEIQSTDDFEFYEPNIRQTIQRRSGLVTGKKTFSYFLIPHEPGSFHLGNYFEWIFFNTASKKYDTLRSTKTLAVTGESYKNQNIENTDIGDFYDYIHVSSNNLDSFAQPAWINTGVYIFIFLAFSTTVFLFFKK